ncbi:MAG: bifunctional UDP-N-acetylmuramoyl-tripeptide:D-alanyl-D-alanine ligase/alanine racemase [Mongoliibacter sp.]|uniref:bifunctional UDP-N-acetylmuramoyl-tripeptide:D-alanyl-D-alanine ligase/alanine racemase n=1 Tax=Mongoliibacter sp. TaxID=2022438 RepID=UPI0012F119C5|nr:bifunctional UDP-N-acetylmuramoyl-tripeptide:D-alanyl-D-alanine ligase/alanine racemase [Mongoliibacter sp.]TVP45158.1 MAG: bifunctional UDP-N-acetylmuramoyl-tripeptide:D-alanyl-D-alanine ligase/alanine racemase [Mongoliibacter sp.]
MMQALTAGQVAEITKGSLLSGSVEGAIHAIVIDSRNILNPSGSLFVALRGAKFDGHDFIKEVFELGGRHFLVAQDFDAKLFPEATFIGVRDAHIAIQALAAYQRKLFLGPLVSITGSNGKTIVKEWLGQVLGTHFTVAKSPKSYNSQVGVPLSIFGIESQHQVAIMEAGISKPGEMAKLEKILKPNMGIFTNIGTAHEEGFASETQKLQEKIRLFENCSFIIYRKEQKMPAELLEAVFNPEKLISWSENQGADFTYTVKKEEGKSKILMMRTDLSVFTFWVPFVDEASLENIRHVITAAISLGMDNTAVQKGLDHLKAVDMRLTLKPGINQCLLIDDTYNNDLAGLKLALDFMAAQRPKNRKILILSDLLQVGEKERVYEEIGQLCNYYQIDYLIGVGAEISLVQNSFVGNSLFYPNTKLLLSQLQTDFFNNDLVLITGARSFGFEEIVNRLQQRVHGTTLEINLNALTHNYNFYKSKLHPKTKVMVMVKAFAYGGGAAEIANHLQQLKADYLAVAYTDEGIALREEGIQMPIMVLNPVQESFMHLVKQELEPVVYSLSFFRQLGIYCKTNQKHLKVHLDLDTGMHRLGFEQEALEELKRLILEFPQLEIASIYTHLVGADESEHEEFTLEQLKQFSEMVNEISQTLNYKPLIHALNSAGISRYPDHQMDMVRLGIGLYGVEVSGIFDGKLKPVSTLKTTISQIKFLKKGQTIGYGRKGIMDKDGKIATIALGYADGFDRRFSNGGGYVLINGKKAKVIGNVCMDMTMVDISDIEAKEGDEVVIYGPGISLIDLAKRIGTIPYELLTNISSRVKRVYYLD